MQVLSTPRLRLRWFGEQDAPLILELVNDPGWLRNIGNRNLHNLDDARAWIASALVAPYHRQGFGLWAVERAADGAVAGMCGLVRRDSLPDVDVGYALLPAFRGQGYAREAAAACLEHGAKVLGLRRILAITYPHNADSVRVLEAIGMRLERRTTLAGETAESLVYEWRP